MVNRFQHLLDKRREDYKTWAPVYSSALREYVFFNMQGFNHLRFKITNTPRKPSETMYKLGLLPLVRSVIHTATRVDQYERRFSPVGGSRKRVMKEMEYWGLVALVGRQNTKIKIVLRRVVGGKQIYFWSVMKLSENQKAPTV